VSPNSEKVLNWALNLKQEFLFSLPSFVRFCCWCQGHQIWVLLLSHCLSKSPLAVGIISCSETHEYWHACWGHQYEDVYAGMRGDTHVNIAEPLKDWFSRWGTGEAASELSLSLQQPSTCSRSWPSVLLLGRMQDCLLLFTKACSMRHALQWSSMKPERGSG
jgi:hypothetical protein